MLVYRDAFDLQDDTNYTTERYWSLIYITWEMDRMILVYIYTE